MRSQNLFLIDQTWAIPPTVNISRSIWIYDSDEKSQCSQLHALSRNMCMAHASLTDQLDASLTDQLDTHASQTQVRQRHWWCLCSNYVPLFLVLLWTLLVGRGGKGCSLHPQTVPGVQCPWYREDLMMDLCVSAESVRTSERELFF